MSRKSIAEYVAEKRRVYANSGSAKRTRLIDEVCETLDYTRKYIIKLLNGAIDLRPKLLSIRQRKIQSVQYLTNQKSKCHLSGARPT